ncbi:urea ABC transporter substrate-binding protein [Pseudonocardiaceae bacterium YIM PH 21723]|nr:urea ABC transporter substrate-binding protein [Pseudonocardiaceae bacterium YIM PH 21723]
MIDSIRVGVLHSSTGPVALSAKPNTDATLLAIEELNSGGGLLGRPIEPIVVDGHSDWQLFADEVRALVAVEQVNAIFGGCTPESRRTIVPIVEELGSLLLYPASYEGGDTSRHVVYTGAAPNQFIVPAVRWFFGNHGRRHFLVGSEGVFSRMANAIVRDQLTELWGFTAGEEYLGDPAVVARRIREAEPDAIISTVVGDRNLDLLHALRAEGISPSTTPMLSLTVSEAELEHVGPDEIAGLHLGLTYFQSLAAERNFAFLARFRERYGAHRVLTDAACAAYAGVRLWAQAVERAGSVTAAEVVGAIRGQRFDSTYVDDNLHTWRRARIATVQPDGQLRVAWTSDAVIQPIPYPTTRSRAAWDDLAKSLHGTG